MFMNSIHEQCPKSDSETELSPKTGSKLSQVHKAPNLAQPMHIGAHRRAQSRSSAVLQANAAMSWAQGLAVS